MEAADHIAAERTAASPKASVARQILLQAVLLGLLADAALRRAGAGYGWTLWILALVVTAALLTRTRGERLGWERSGWLALALAGATAFAWRDAGMLRVANVAGTLVALALASMTLAGAPAPSILAARIRDVIAAWVFAARDAVVGMLLLVFRDAELESVVARSVSARLHVVRAFLLALPILLVFGTLLASADPVFGAIFSLPSVDFATVASHAFVIGAFSWISAGWLRGAHLPTMRSIPRVAAPFTLRAMDVGVSLGALAALFALFVGLQARWLFGGAEVVLATTGLSLAEYARGGFFELVVVAALVLPLTLVSRAAVGGDAHALRVHRQLSLVLLVLLAAIMASAVTRMRLYVSHFGLTEDRFYALAFMGWLALVFTAMALTVLRGWSRPFAAATVGSAFLVLAALNVANPDVIIARTNLARGGAAAGVDYPYLARLSGDAAPLVARALASATPSAATCEAATRMRARWIRVSGEDAHANLGARRGRDAVLELLDGTTARRLCPGVAEVP